MLPDRLSADTAVAIDQYLARLWHVPLCCPEMQVDADLVVSMADLIERLLETSGLSCQWTLPHDTVANTRLFGFDGHGAAFLLTRQDRRWQAWPVTSLEPSAPPAAIGSWRRIRRELALTEPLLACAPAPTPTGADPVPSESAHGKAFDPAGGDPLWKEFRRHGPLIRSILLISMMVAFLGVVTPLGFQTFADKILPYQAQGSLLVLAGFLLAGALATSLLQCYRDYQEHVLSARYASALGGTVFGRLLYMDIPYFDRRTVGDLTKLVEQIEESTQFLTRQLLGSLVSLLSLFVIVPLLFVYSPSLTLIVLAISAFMTLTVAGSLLPLRARVMQAYHFDARFQSATIELLKGIRTIKSLTNEHYFLHRTRAAMSDALHGQFRVDRLNTIVSAVVGFQSQLITLAVIFFGAQAVFSQAMTIGQLIAFNMLANNVVQPLVSLVMTGQGWANFRLAQRKLGELAHASAAASADCDHSVRLTGDIQLKGVTFGYEPDSPVLRNLDLDVRAGETLGIVGASGSGKSTLTSLLMGFYQPWSGTLRIGDRDVDVLPQYLLRARIATVPQHSFLFNTSVAWNTRLGRLTAPQNALDQALDAAHCRSFVAALPEGANTALSENGDNLSGGQRQRLAIARALVRDSDILIFDEATSALDPKTEADIRQTIMSACEGRTALIIAHRLSTLTDCDRIAMMAEGRVIAIGTHDELMGAEPAYRRLVRAAGSLPQDKPA